MVPKEDRLLSFPSCLAQLAWDSWTTRFDRDEIALYDESTSTCNTVCYADGYYWLGIKVRHWKTAQASYCCTADIHPLWPVNQLKNNQKMV